MRYPTLPVFLVAVMMAATVTSAQVDAPRSEPDGEVVREVVRMLDAEVAEEVILIWLERGEHFEAALSSNDLIALTQAKASRELIDALLRPPAEPAVQAPESATSGPPSGPVEFSVHYRPYRDAEDTDDEQWHLFVYLDGLPLIGSDGTNWLSKSQRVRELSRDLPPGAHVLRLLQERHVRRGEHWRHEARVCPESIEIVGDGRKRRLEIEIKEPIGLGFGNRGNYRWLLLENDMVDEAPLTGPPDEWPPLCEAVESGLTDGEKIPRTARKMLARCVRWSGLWPDEAMAPDRATVREMLARNDFRPE